MSSGAQPLCLLALDGGGVRGFSELYILNEMMLRIQKHKKLPAPPKPCEVFDMICGTSTGGLIALMLGRLRMSVDEVIDQYCTVAREVFGKPKKNASEGRFRATNLEKAIQNTVEKYGSPKGRNDKADPNLTLLDEQAQSSNTCHVFVCSKNARAMEIPRLFRSYRTYTADEYEDMTIWEAARATSAAPTFFKRLKKGPKDAQEEFLDGGLGCNNPTKVLLQEIATNFSSADMVSCIISIGTGKTQITEFKSPGWFQRRIPLDLINALKAMATDCDNIAMELGRRFSSRPGIYFRFNVEHGLESVGMEEWKELGNIKAKTIAYLGQDPISKTVNEAANALTARDPKIAITELVYLPVASVPSMPKCLVPFERRVSCFIGREDVLAKMHTVFSGAEATHVKGSVIVLRAMGGQGKTQVALEYCSRASNEDYDYILWANAETQTSFKQSFDEFAKALPQPKRTKEAIMPQTMTEETSATSRVREQLSGKKYLLVIDNLDVPSEHKDIKTYLTLGGIGHIIITSRHIDTERLGSSIPLPPFSMKEGVELLTYQSGRATLNDDDARDQEQIIHALGGLPLGLDQAALLMREKNLTYFQFLKEFRESRASLLDKDLPEFWEYEKLTYGDAEEMELRRKIGIQTTWTMSFDFLRSRPQGESKCHLLTLSAHLSSTSISQAIFSPFLKRVKVITAVLTDAASQSLTEEDFGSDPVTVTELRTLILATKWAKPLLEEIDAQTLSGSFSEFVRDAYKIGLLTSTQYHEIRGTTYSMHPLVSRWLVDKNDNDFIIEAFFVTKSLLDQFENGEFSLSMLPELHQHIIACTTLNRRLPITRRLGTEDLYRVGAAFSQHLTDSDLPQIKDAIDILMCAFRYSEQISMESNVSEYVTIPESLGFEFLRSQQFTEAKKFLEISLTRQRETINITLSAQPDMSLRQAVFTIGMLVQVYIELSDETLLLSICSTVLDRIKLISHCMSLSQSSDPSDTSSPNLLEVSGQDNIDVASSTASRTLDCLRDLADGFWLWAFYQIGVSFTPRYDLGKVAIINLLEDLDQRFHTEDKGKLSQILLAAQTNLALMCFASKQWQEAEDHFQTVLQAVRTNDTSDITLAIELHISIFMIATHEFTNTTTIPFMDSVRKRVASIGTRRLMSQVQATYTKKVLNLVDSTANIFMRDPVPFCWTLSQAITRICLPGITTNSGVRNESDELAKKILTKDIVPQDLLRAEENLKYCVDAFGHSKKTIDACRKVYTIAYMLREWETSLRFAYEQIQRYEASGEEPDILDVHMVGRASLRLQKQEEYTIHTEKYPNGDWSRVEDEERTNP